MQLKKASAILTALLMTAVGVSGIYPAQEKIFSVTAMADEENFTVINAEGSSNAVRSMGAYESRRRYASPVQSYIYDNNDGTFTILDNGNNGVISADIYNIFDSSYVSTVSIPMELSNFGGFYSGEKYNYIVFSQNNPDKDDSVEVIRIVKYSKDFERISSASVNNCFTDSLYYMGSLRMAEGNGEVVVHMSRLRYDGHQSQLTLMFDSDTLELNNKNDIGTSQRNHVSHSFNQFVAYDNGDFLICDHGDSYPRTVGLNIYSEGQFTNKVTLMEIPGNVGANATGVTVGGLSFSDTHYLAAINSVDHSKVTKYTSRELEGLEVDERDIVILAGDKETGVSEKVYLTDYVDNGLLGSTPYLVKTDDNSFFALWEEFDAYTEESIGVRYVKLNGEGKPVSEVKDLSDAKLSADCQPVIIDGSIKWYVNRSDGTRDIYNIELERKKTEQNIIVSQINEATYGSDPYVINVIPDGSSGLSDFVFSSSNPDVAYFSSDNQLNICGVGETEITVSQAGNDQYSEFTYTQKLTVNPKNITVESISYGNKTAVIDGIVDGDDVSIKFDDLEIGELVTYDDVQANVICSGISLTGSDAKKYQVSDSTKEIRLDRDEIIIADISCDNNTDKNVYFKGSTVTVTANTGLGSYVTDWILNGETVSSDEDFTFVAEKDISLTAVTEDAPLGDVDEDGTVSSSDASMVLGEYALLSTGGSGTFTRKQKASADVDNDKMTDSGDASVILSYYAYLSSGGKITDMKQWLASND